MPNTYKIIIRNKAAKFQRFLLFSEAPNAATKSKKAKAFTNVWAEAPGVPGPHGKTNFTVSIQEWAVCGTSSQKLNDKVIVETADAAPVNLNAGNTSGSEVFMTVQYGGAGFDPKKSATTEAKGAFAIRTDSYDGPSNPLIFFGLGRQNPKTTEEDIVPVAVWEGDPTEVYEVIPKEVFYIATGDFKMGQIVNVRSIGKIAKIDFSSGAGLGMDVATVDFTPTHEYTPPKFSKTLDDDGDVEENS